MTARAEDYTNKFPLMSFTELAQSTCGKLLFDFAQVQVFFSVSIDSRNIKLGSLFVPLRGEHQDGHIYIEAALKSGSYVFFADEEYLNCEKNKKNIEELCKNYKASCICVKNNLYALQNAAKFYLMKFPSLHKIGITGSSGKTTTKEILASIYSVKYNTITNKGNLNSETGLALSVFEVRPEHQVGIFELGMNRRGEIKELADILLPNSAIITNIGTAHIGILGSQQAIAEEKKQIFSNFTDDCIGFVPECAFTGFLKQIQHGKFFVYSQKKLKGLEKIEDCGILGSKMVYKGEEIMFPIPGKYNAQNAIACIALAEKDNFSAGEIKKGLETVQSLFGRSQILYGFVTCFMDCYNANPDSMHESINFCDSVQVSGSKHYVLASMLELGEKSFESHCEIVKKSFASDADNIYFFGDDMAYAFENELKTSYFGKKKVFSFKTSQFEQLKNVLSANFKKDDFVLLKGSRSLALERLDDIMRGGEIDGKVYRS